MSDSSPDVVLYDNNSNALAVQNAVAIPASTPALMIAGSDGTNSRYITIDTSGRLLVVGAGTAGTPVGGVVTIQGVSGGTVVPVSGTVAVTQNTSPWVVSASGNFNNASVGVTAAAPPADATYVGGLVTTAVESGLTSGDMYPISLTTAGLLRVDGSNVTQPVSIAATVTVSASGNFNNASVGATAAAPPADATYMGALVTTAAQSGLTSGDMYPLNMTTTGQLRIDGVYPLTTAVATAVDMYQVGAVVTTAAPTYTTATVNALSLDTTGNLRVLANQPTAANLNATVTQGPANTLANAWSMKITDATNGPVAVTPATTAPTAAEPALVVTMSPNSPTSAFNGASVGPTGSAAPASATYVGALTATAAPTYATGLMEPLSLTLNGLLRVDGVYPSNAAIGTDAMLVGGVDGSDGLLRNLTVAVDRTAMTIGVATGVPIVGSTNGFARIIRNNRLGHVTPGYQTLLANDAVEGTTINSWMWTQSTATMTISQSTGLLILNANLTTTTTTYAIITSNKQFAFYDQSPSCCFFKALITQTTNAVNEIGFGAPTTNTAIVQYGAFFRITGSGSVFAVTSNQGSETVSANLGTISITSYYVFSVFVEDDGARFVMETSTGVPLVDYYAPTPLVVPGVASFVSHLPAFARVYTTGAAGAAPQTRISSFSAWQFDINTSKPWAHQLGSTGRDSAISPISFTQTTQLANGAAPGAFVPSNTAAGNADLGGEANITMSATSENLLSVFAYQIPSPYTLILDSSIVNAPAVTTAFTTTATILEWVLIYNASGNDLATATGQIRRSLGFHTVAASATVGTLFNGGALVWSPYTPIACLPGTYVHLAVKVILGAATGAYRASWNVGGYFE